MFPRGWWFSRDHQLTLIRKTLLGREFQVRSYAAASDRSSSTLIETRRRAHEFHRSVSVVHPPPGNYMDRSVDPLGYEPSNVSPSSGRTLPVHPLLIVQVVIAVLFASPCCAGGIRQQSESNRSKFCTSKPRNSAPSRGSHSVVALPRENFDWT